MFDLVSREETCPSNFSDDSRAEPISGTFTFHRIIFWTSLACTMVNVIACTYMFIGQLFNYYHPQVQKLNLRIIVMPVWLGVFCFIGVAGYRTTHYVEAIAELYEIFTITVIYHLMLAYLLPTKDFHAQVAFFSNPKYHGYKFFRWRYIFVMQVLPGRIITTIITIALTARSCRTGRSFENALLVLSLIDAVQLIIAICGVLPTLRKQAKHLQLVEPKIFSKLLSIKVVVVAQMLIELILRILTATGTLSPSATLSYNDLNLGLTAFVTVLLAFMTSLLMLPYFRPKEFKDKALADIDSIPVQMTQQLDYDGAGDMMIGKMPVDPAPKKRHSPLRALFDAINITDIVIVAEWRACKLLVHRKGYSIPLEQGNLGA